MHKRLAVAVGFVIALVIPLVLLAQTWAYTAYVPMVHRGDVVPIEPTPTPTSTPTPPPVPTGPCAINDPGFTEGLTAWMIDNTPEPYTEAAVCTRLVVNGQPVYGALVTALVYYRSSTAEYEAITDPTGVAVMTFNIGGAIDGYLVPVEVEALVNGQYMLAGTSFTPTDQVAPTPTTGPACDPSYPTVCIPPPPPYLNCADIPYRRFEVRPPDPHGFDRDKDGVGCESD